jgi:hypothetical protein
MPEINKRYVRTSPVGEESIVSVKSEEEVKCHTDLVAAGYKYTEIVPSVAPGGVCISCEG